MDEKLKSDNMQKRAVCYVYVIFWEQSGQADVENGAMLTIYYLFRYTSDCTISWSNFQNFLCLRRQGGIDPLTKILRTSPLTKYWFPTSSFNSSYQLNKTVNAFLWILVYFWNKSFNKLIVQHQSWFQSCLSIGSEFSADDSWCINDCKHVSKYVALLSP